MPAAANNGQRKGVTVLPLHIDTTSFTNPPQPITYPWRRVVNKRQLPFLILLVFFIFSISTNFVQHGRHRRITKYTASILMHANDRIPNPPLNNYHHAIIVPGHAIYTGGPSRNDLGSDENWVLEPFQRGGQVQTFVRHIQKAIDLAERDPDAVIVFSGGQTRAAAGPRSEGQSYWEIAQLLVDSDTLKDRMIVEDYARDSHENLLFSLCRFYEMTGGYPSAVTVVGFEFKKRRFQEVHLASIRFPEDQFNYVGIDPPFDPVSATERMTGEVNNSLSQFQKDLYGCRSPLNQKRVDRNPFRRRHPYRITCPALTELISYCPVDNSIFSGLLPWSN